MEEFKRSGKQNTNLLLRFPVHRQEFTRVLARPTGSKPPTQYIIVFCTSANLSLATQITAVVRAFTEEGYRASQTHRNRCGVV